VECRKEFQQAKEKVEKKMEEALSELEETIKIEEEERANIIAREKEAFSKIEKEIEDFNEDLLSSQENNQLNQLNALLQQAIENGDKKAIDEILIKLSNL
jgi:DNA replication protein DnaC